MKHKLTAVILILLLLFSAGAVSVRAQTDTAAQAAAMCDGILSYKESAAGVNTPQQLIDTALCDQAGISAEFYVIALSQYGSYDFSAYESALLRYLDSNEVYSATTREKYALALAAAGSADPYIAQVTDNAIGQQGIMSLVFGLHLLNNGYTSSYATVNSVIDDILSMQLSDGGWSVIGSAGDVDVTAMTLQSLAPYCGDSGVNQAVARALTLLSSRQQSDGGYISMGQENLESAAQVLCALSILGIDAGADDRYIKNGNTVIDAMMRYRLSDGSFSHAGEGTDQNATMQAFYSAVAYLRMLDGRGSLYILDSRTDSSVTDEPAQTPQNQNQTKTKNRDQNQSQDKRSTEVIHTPNGDYIEIINERGERETVRTESTEKTKDKQNASSSTEATSPRATYGVLELPDYDRDSAVGKMQSATADSAAPSSPGGGYKVYAVIITLALAGGVCIVLFALRRRHYKNFIAVGIVAVAAIVFILLTNFSTSENYYRDTAPAESPAGEVTLSICCDTITDDDDLPYFIPADGMILDKTVMTISEDDTVMDLLTAAARRYNLHIDVRAGASYVSGINYLYEFDYGDLSGWMYRVNGEIPSLSASQYTLSDGDTVEWLYTCDIGNDL